MHTLTAGVHSHCTCILMYIHSYHQLTQCWTRVELHISTHQEEKNDEQWQHSHEIDDCGVKIVQLTESISCLLSCSASNITFPILNFWRLLAFTRNLMVYILTRNTTDIWQFVHRWSVLLGKNGLVSLAKTILTLIPGTCRHTGQSWFAIAQDRSWWYRQA